MERAKRTLARVLAAWRERTRRPVDETTAWACLVANILLWPGLGGAALRELSGAIQMLLSLASGIAVIVCGARILLVPFDDATADTGGSLRKLLGSVAAFAAV